MFLHSGDRATKLLINVEAINILKFITLFSSSSMQQLSESNYLMSNKIFELYDINVILIIFEWHSVFESQYCNLSIDA